MGSANISADKLSRGVIPPWLEKYGTQCFVDPQYLMSLLSAPTRSMENGFILEFNSCIKIDWYVMKIINNSTSRFRFIAQYHVLRGIHSRCGPCQIRMDDFLQF